MMADRVYNFSAGPSVMPEEALLEAQKDLLNYKGSGMSVMEMSHRSAVFAEIFADTREKLRKALSVPDTHEILFLQGGATLQFAAIPMNLSCGKTADYAVTGNFSNKAAKEAEKYCTVHLAASTAPEHRRIPSQEELSLSGRHNVYNSLAAGLAANIAGIKKESIRKSLSDFPGVEHRLEKVCDVRGVHYVNDSKATNVDACWYALESMKTRVVLIIGGKDKGNDYEPIKPLIREKCSALVYLGADNAKLHQNFDEMGIPVRDTHSMRECMEACYELAKPGETVLLSPCCASFDLFKNMEDRGEQFKAIARSL